MDPQLFDRFARLLCSPQSRRTTWRVLLGLALSGGAATGAGGRVSAAPTGSTLRACTDGDGSCRGDACCGGTCCPGRCFTMPETGQPYCCTEPEYVICGNPTAATPDEHQVCCPKGGPNPCSCAGGGLISGSYRRR